MGKNKLQKFDDMARYPHVFEYPYGVLQAVGCPLQGRWHEEVFRNTNPIVLELGCGRGEYAVGLARRCPDKNLIGVDIKGARMWSGARQSADEGLTNVAFLRTGIELIDRFFAPGEVSEIWITFPDPQMKKATKRLTGTRFIDRYRRILAPGGTIHLKTDSPFMYAYTCAMIAANGLPIAMQSDDIYASGTVDDVLAIRTYYEQQWLERGMTIKYIRFGCDTPAPLVEPEVEIEYDAYRSYNRSRRSAKAAGQ